MFPMSWHTCTYYFLCICMCLGEPRSSTEQPCFMLRIFYNGTHVPARAYIHRSWLAAVLFATKVLVPNPILVAKKVPFVSS